MRRALAALLLAACGPACPGEPRDLAACEAACERGDALGCAWAGELTRVQAIAAGADGEADAREWFERACERATPAERHLCLLSVPLSGPPSRAQIARVRTLCDEGLLLACHELMQMTVVAVSMPIELPPSEPAEEPPAVTIAVTRAGELFLDGAPTTLDALGTLQAGRAVIAADREVEYARVVEVIDALRRAGVTRYAIQVEPSE